MAARNSAARSARPSGFDFGATLTPWLSTQNTALGERFDRVDAGVGEGGED